MKPLSKSEQLLKLGVPRRAADRIAQASAERNAKGRFEFRAEADEAEILIYDFIGFDYFDEGMTAKRFYDELQNVSDASSLRVRINSPGGDVWDGMAIYNMLVESQATTRVTIEGIAASAASLIAMAGDTVEAYETSQIMIHDAWTIALGNEQELREIADTLEKIDGQIADVYANKSGGDAQEFRRLMDEETFATAKEARDLGIVDTVIELAAGNKGSARSRNRAKVKIQINKARLGLTA
jgi:ATP-dependent Clp endopeptidase proteolytic subunit ClpP